MKYLICVVAMLAGCAGAPVETEPAGADAAAPAVPAAAAPEVAPVGEAPAPPAALVVVPDSTRQLAEGPPTPGSSTSVHATAKTNRLDIVIDNIVSYCEPAPWFTAAANGDALELRLVRPEDGVSRCFGTHHVEVHIDLPGRNGLQKIVLQDHDGKTLAEAPITGS